MKVVSTEALTRFLTVIKGDLAKKEPSITKKSAFNLDKTDTVQNNRDLLFTSKGAYDLKTEITNSIATKMNTSGGTFTGPISMSGSNTINITHNYGIKSYLSNGSLDYVLYVNASDQLVLGFNGRPITTQGTITSPTFIGALQGKADNSKAADSATKLSTARSITVGSRSINFDGTSNIEFDLLDSSIKNLKTIGNLTLTGELPNAGGTNTFDIFIPMASNTTTLFCFELIISGHWSHTNISGSDTFEISCLPSNNNGFSSFKVTPISNTTGGKYFNFKSPTRSSDGIRIPIYYSGNNNSIEIKTTYKYGDKPLYKTITVGSPYRDSAGGTRYDVYTTSNKPTLGELGAFSASGGTINGNTTVSGTLNVTSNLSVTGNINGAKTYNAVWNDYAEFFPKVKGYKTEPGDIIALSTTEEGEVYELATDKHKLIAGVHSDQYGHLIGGENPENGEDYVEYNKDKYIPVGLAGRVPVKFSGVAEKGMKVVPSDIPGVGREFTLGDNYENVIGYIVENNYEEGVRRVKIKIGK